MKHYYKEILESMGEPIWWDENAVPRYSEFSPDERALIYSSSEVALVDIRCQNCGEIFYVCFSAGAFSPFSIKEAILEQKLNWGDPPNNNCCGVGSTMSSVPVKVLQYWSNQPDSNKIASRNLLRCPEYEIDLRVDWFDEYYARFLGKDQMNANSQDWSADWKTFIRDNLEAVVRADDSHGTKFVGDFGSIVVSAKEEVDPTFKLLVSRLEVETENKAQELYKKVLELLELFTQKKSGTLEIKTKNFSQLQSKN